MLLYIERGIIYVDTHWFTMFWSIHDSCTSDSFFFRVRKFPSIRDINQHCSIKYYRNSYLLNTTVSDYYIFFFFLAFFRSQFFPITFGDRIQTSTSSNIDCCSLWQMIFRTKHDSDKTCSMCKTHQEYIISHIKNLRFNPTSR